VSTEQQNDAAGRLLKALSPALADELGKILEDQRASLQAEFDERLQTAVRDAEAALKQEMENQRVQAVETAVAEATQTTRTQITEELQDRFNNVLEETTRAIAVTHQAEILGVQSEFAAARDGWQAERDQLSVQLDHWKAFADMQNQLANARSQSEILVRWLKFAEPFGSSVAVYTAKADGLAFWKSRGAAAFPDIISPQTTDPDSYFKTVNVRGKTVAAVCAIPPFQADALDYLVSVMERSVELFALKLRIPAPPVVREAVRTT
jgi:hypothetical protein